MLENLLTKPTLLYLTFTAASQQLVVTENVFPTILWQRMPRQSAENTVSGFLAESETASILK